MALSIGKGLLAILIIWALVIVKDAVWFRIEKRRMNNGKV